MTHSLPTSIRLSDRPVARRSLRVAVVTETYPPEINGVALSLAKVVEGLRALRHEVQLIRPRQQKAERADCAERFEEVLLRGLPIPRYPHLKMGLPSTATLIELWSVHRPDVVHIATEGPLGWSALRAASRLGLPVTSDFRTNFHAYSAHYGIGWLKAPIMAYLRGFHNRTQCTMVPTVALRRELIESGFHDVVVVPRGVDTRRFDPQHRCRELRSTWGAGDSTRVVLCVGRLAAEKNLGLLLTAFAAMRDVEPDMKLVIVGDGPARQELQGHCPDAVFAGQRTGDDLARHYASADLFLFPSLTETFGNVTPEAMASALPVLAFDNAAAQQLIRCGENGLLAPVGDAGQFVHLACRMVREGRSARAMGVKARGAAQALQWSHIVSTVEGVLLRAVDAALRERDALTLSPSLS